jgi:hypothetical protein
VRVSRRYFYGEPGQEVYMCDDPEEAAENIRDQMEEGDKPELIELTPSRWAGTCCVIEEGYFDPYCGRYECDNYEPMNGVSGRCKNLQYGLKETGRKWIVNFNETITKISGRKK